MYEVKEPLWQFIDHWQTLIAGLLALAAAVMAVWATIKSANREITAAQEQTKAAQHQTAVTRELERRRLAREGYAFHAMLEAAMRAVIDDVGMARNLLPPSFTSSHSAVAYAVRQRVKRVGFAELRNAFIRFGGPRTADFLQLDKEIEDFAGQVGGVSVGSPLLTGLDAGILEQLNRIERQANALRDHATRGMKFCRDELAEELIDLET